jgi:hypothetical protein
MIAPGLAQYVLHERVSEDEIAFVNWQHNKLAPAFESGPQKFRHVPLPSWRRAALRMLSVN